MKIKNIKIAALLLCFITMSIGTASAQLKFGVEAGMDIADNKINNNMLSSKNRLGFTVGPTMEIGIPLVGLGVDVSLLYGYKKYKVEEKNIADADISNYHYISVPVNVKKEIRFVPGVIGGFIVAGPYASVKLGGGDLEIKDEADGTYKKFKSKNFEMGVNAGVGVQLMGSLDIGIYYRCKLTDNYSANKGEISNLKDKKYQTWSVGATYFF